MVGAVAGLLTLLSALVLGLLIWTAYGVYAGPSVASQTLAAKVLQLDLALADYGSEANDVRAQLRQGLGRTIYEIWGSDESDADFVANNFSTAIHNLRNRDAALANLHHSTETHVLRARQSYFHSPRGDRHGVGDVSLLWLRTNVGRQDSVFPRGGGRRPCDS